MQGKKKLEIDYLNIEGNIFGCLVFILSGLFLLWKYKFNFGGGLTQCICCWYQGLIYQFEYCWLHISSYSSTTIKIKSNDNSDHSDVQTSYD